MPRPLRIEYPGAIDPVNNPQSPVRSDQFSYDALGNRKGWNYVANKGWMSFLRRDNGLNQYTSWENNDPNPPGHWGTAIYHDDNSPWAPHTAPPGNGVMMAEGNLVASYNALNQPVAMIPTGSSNIYWFGYDPLGRCVKRVVGPSMESGTATYFYYDGWSLIQEGPSATASDRIYMLGNRVDEIVADYAAANGQWMFHHSGGRGHNMLLTAANGSLAEQNEYDAFGRPYFFNAAGQPQTASNYGNRFLFTGREYLPELKLYDYRARMYQPELGRFMSPDPKHFAAGDYNLYRYCHNDPVNRSDPTGMQDDKKDETVRLREIKFKTPLGSLIKQWVVTGMVTMTRSAFEQLVSASFKTNVDMTQSVYKDGYKSQAAKARDVRTNSRGAFDLTKKEEVFRYESGHGGMALMLHVHNYDNGHGSTMFPNAKDDWKAVREFQAPMLFTSEPLHQQGMGIFITPNGQKSPTESVVDLTR